ncbi:MAG: response regulator [candidate division KSB1 bacterium]|nr:response regulator [candidate division KSB1 bacterium]MDZ7276419.1 response regulator [candidate division KSB1 bacterium]MDZ7288089.1 response regulator [candidate division KSB1 bacterium]MDZ7300190.1 response regulator [candidate division KSB1 bacterium]MDZ7305761.1 response regulator [candidate division KSB1 bacterium]
MDNPTILVADGDPKNLQILRENLEAAGFEVIVASDGLQAWQKISSSVPDLILSEVNLPKLDGFQLLEKLKADPVTSSIPLMFLTNRRELQDRVRSLRGGVKDYMIKPLHIKEVLARIRMILRRMERIKEEEAEPAKKLVGRLEEFSPVDLIESFGVERKTGVLTLHNENNRSGEIYFRDGAVVNASLGNLKAEKAVYQMLPWKRGHFTMVFKDIVVPDEISVSNLGLLLQGFKRMEERERLFKLLPSPETTFVITETFRAILQKRELTTEVARFISLIDGRRDILQIIDESTYDDIKTLERLVKLYQQGFIKPAKSTLTSEDEERDLSANLAEPPILQRLAVEPQPPTSFRVTAVRGEKATPKPAPEPTSPTPVRPAPLPRQPEPPPPVAPAAEENKFAPGQEPEEPAEVSHVPPVEAGETQSFKFPEPESAPPEEDIDLTDDSELSSLPSFWHEHADEIWGAPHAGNGSDNAMIEIQEEQGEEPAAAGQGRTAAGEPDTRMRESRPPAIIGKEVVGGGEPEMQPVDLDQIMSQPTEVSAFLRDEFQSESAPPAELPVSQLRTQPGAEFLPPSVAADDTTPEPHQPLAASPSAPITASAPLPAAGPQTAPELPAKPQATSATKAGVTAPVTAATPSTVTSPAPSSAPAPAAGEEASVHRITQALMRLCAARGIAKPRLVVIGHASGSLSAMVGHLLGPQASVRKIENPTFRHLEIGERILENGAPLEVIGVSMEQQFTQLLQAVARDLVGYILLLQANRRDDLSYFGYLLKVLKSGYRLPFGIAVLRENGQQSPATATVRDLVNAEPSDYLLDCNPSDAATVAAFLEGLASDANLTRW